MILGITAHRPSRLGTQRASLRSLTKNYLVEHRPTLIWSGAALGGDQDICGIALRLGIPYALAIPFPGQAAHWIKTEKQVYEQLLLRANLIEVVSKVDPHGRAEARQMLFARNAFLVAQVERLLAWYDGRPRGGTAHAVGLANRTGIDVAIIWPKRSPQSLLP